MTLPRTLVPILAPARASVASFRGPETAAFSPLDGPFRLDRWHKEQQKAQQKKTHSTTTISSWPADTGEHQGAIYPVDRGRSGLLVLYDKPKKSRIHGSRYTADWIPVI